MTSLHRWPSGYGVWFRFLSRKSKFSLGSGGSNPPRCTSHNFITFFVFLLTTCVCVLQVESSIKTLPSPSCMFRMKKLTQRLLCDSSGHHSDRYKTEQLPCSSFPPYESHLKTGKVDRAKPTHIMSLPPNFPPQLSISRSHQNPIAHINK